MFNGLIESTPFTRESAAPYFNNIRGVFFNDDATFLTMLRVLLHERIQNGEIVRQSIENITYPACDIEGASVSAVVRIVASRLVDPGIHIVNVRSESAEAFYKKFFNPTEGFHARNYGWKELEDVEQFLASHMNARVLINEDAQMTLVFVTHLTMKRWHFISSLIPRLLPWYFVNKPLTPEEVALCASLTERDPEPFLSRIKALADGMDFEEKFIRESLQNFERRGIQVKVDSTKDTIRTLRSEMQMCLTRYTQKLQQIEDENVRLQGLMQAMNDTSDSSEIVDFFLRNKSITLVDAGSESIDFIVTTYLDQFDPDMFETMIEREFSHLNRGFEIYDEAFADSEVRKKFLYEIFGGEPSFKIKTCAYFSLGMYGSVHSGEGYRFSETGRNCLPNPHIWHYGCLGNNERYIYECLEEGNFIGAIAQCIASTQSFNIGDVPVAQAFLEDLFKMDVPFIEFADGTCHTPSEALEALGLN